MRITAARSRLYRRSRGSELRCERGDIRCADPTVTCSDPEEDREPVAGEHRRLGVWGTDTCPSDRDQRLIASLCPGDMFNREAGALGETKERE